MVIQKILGSIFLCLTLVIVPVGASTIKNDASVVAAPLIKDKQKEPGIISPAIAEKLQEIPLWDEAQQAFGELKKVGNELKRIWFLSPRYVQYSAYGALAGLIGIPFLVKFITQKVSESPDTDIMIAKALKTADPLVRKHLMAMAPDIVKTYREEIVKQILYDPFNKIKSSLGLFIQKSLYPALLMQSENMPEYALG